MNGTSHFYLSIMAYKLIKYVPYIILHPVYDNGICESERFILFVRLHLTVIYSSLKELKKITIISI